MLCANCQRSSFHLSLFRSAKDKFKPRVHLLILTLFLSFSAVAQPIAQWTFTGTLAGLIGGFNTANPISLGSAIGSGAFYSASEYYGEDGWPSGGINSNAYMQFRTAPLPGYHLNITSIVLRMRRSQTGIPFGSGPTRWALRSNQDNYATDIATGTLSTSYQNFTITTGSAFMGLTGNISFRLYGYQQSTGFLGENRIVIDDISIFGTGTTLPVKLSHFSGSMVSSDAHLTWSATDVAKGTMFSIERSKDGTSFEEISKMPEEEYIASKEYFFKDMGRPAGIAYYRIKTGEPSGAVHYSAIIKLSAANQLFDKLNFVHASANELRASASLSENGTYQCSLYTMSGMPIFETNVFLNKGENAIALPIPYLAHGSYILSLRQDRRVLNKVFIK